MHVVRGVHFSWGGWFGGQDFHDDVSRSVLIARFLLDEGGCLVGRSCSPPAGTEVMALGWHIGLNLMNMELLTEVALGR